MSKERHIAVLSKELNIVGVPQCCKGISRGNDNLILYTYGMNDCCGVVFYNIKTGDYCLAHLDSGNIMSLPFDEMFKDICPKHDYKNLCIYLTESADIPRMKNFGSIFVKELDNSIFRLANNISSNFETLKSDLSITAINLSEECGIVVVKKYDEVLKNFEFNIKQTLTDKDYDIFEYLKTDHKIYNALEISRMNKDEENPKHLIYYGFRTGICEAASTTLAFYTIDIDDDQIRKFTALASLEGVNDEKIITNNYRKFRLKYLDECLFEGTKNVVKVFDEEPLSPQEILEQNIYNTHIYNEMYKEFWDNNFRDIKNNSKQESANVSNYSSSSSSSSSSSYLNPYSDSLKEKMKQFISQNIIEMRSENDVQLKANEIKNSPPSISSSSSHSTSPSLYPTPTSSSSSSSKLPTLLSSVQENLSSSSTSSASFSPKLPASLNSSKNSIGSHLQSALRPSSVNIKSSSSTPNYLKSTKSSSAHTAPFLPSEGYGSLSKTLNLNSSSSSSSIPTSAASSSSSSSSKPPFRPSAGFGSLSSLSSSSSSTVSNKSGFSAKLAKDKEKKSSQDISKK